MLTTETRENITNLPKLHKALSTQPSPPYTSTGTQQPSVQPGASALHICPAQLRFGPATLTTTKLYPSCGYTGTAQLEQCNEEYKTMSLSLPHPEAA